MSEQIAPVESHDLSQKVDLRSRIMILVANLALCLLSGILETASDPYRLRFEPLNRIGFEDLVKTVHLATLALATILTAWGPWKWWIRALLYVAFVTSIAAVQEVLEVNISSAMAYIGGPFLSFLDRVTRWMVVDVPAIFCLVLFASWLRLRLGPRNVRPPRVSITGVMLATAIVGVVMAIRISTQQAVVHSIFGAASSSRELDQYRFAALTDAAVQGPVAAAIIGCVVASAYRWWPRWLAILLVAGYAGFEWYLIRQSAPQFPVGPGDLQLYRLGGTLMGMFIGWVWIVICIRWLDRSGWPCSRR